MEEEEESNILIELQESSLDDPVMIHENTMLAPVIIEELDESAITDVDMAEFVDTQALTVQDIQDTGYSWSPERCQNDPVQDNSVFEITEETEEPDTLAPDEEDQLTKQFLNGELTFSEYSMRMDRGIDVDTTEIETSRRAFESELAASKKIGSRKSQKSLSITPQKQQRRKRRILPPALQGLMGEANLRFARGEVSLASQMCMEIIRQIPSAPEPFHTLAMIYETDQPEKSLQFALIAAHLSPRDADQWVRLANLSLESGNIKQTITCFSKAIQASPKDVKLYKKRAKLQEQIGDKKGVLRGYMKLLHHSGPEEGENIVKYAKMLAKRFMQDNNNEQALEAMEHVFTKCPERVTLEEVNVMTELLIALKQFHRCLNILAKYTSIQIMYKEPSQLEEDRDRHSSDTGVDGCKRQKLDVNRDCNKESDERLVQDRRKIEFCDIPDDVVVDLKAKFLITLVELNEIKTADKLLPKLFVDEDPEVSGDLFLDVAEALMTKKKFHRALVLLEPLVKSKNFSLAAVWLRHAECWVGCKDLKKAIKSYEIVRKLSPQHLEARLELAKLYKLKGQFNRAIDVLKQDPEVDVLDSGVIYRRTLLLHKVKRYNEYFQSGMLLLSRHCVSLRSRSELTTLTRTNGVRQRLDALQLYRLSRGETLEDENAPTFSKENLPTLKSEFLLFLQMCRLACKQKKYGLFQRMCFSAMTSKRFEKKNSHITFLCLISCVHNNDSYYGYNMVRELVRVCRRSNSWNLLNVIIQRSEDCRHNRFIMRLLGREDAFSYLHILHANNCLVSGTYKYALNHYMSLFKVGPSALLALLIAVTLLQMACQKFSAKKNQLVIQAIAFLRKYSQMRGKDGEQEANYNTARAFHQLGLLPAAVHHYKLVLQKPTPALVLQNSTLLDLKKEAAFNLHLIYTQAESEHVARITMNVTLASEVKFTDLCTILERIAKAPAAKKFEHLQKFIEECRILGDKIKNKFPDSDVTLFPILRLILPQLERIRGPFGFKETTLANLYVRVFCLGKASVDAQKLLHYKAPTSGEQTAGDFAEVAYWVLRSRLPKKESSFTVEQINSILDEIAEKNAANQSKDDAFHVLAHELTAFEQKWFIRIALRDLKLGMGQKKIFSAYHPDAEDLYDVTQSVQQVCDKLKNPKIRMQHGIEVFSPFKPMLLERCKIENIGQFFAKNEKYLVQTKHDGERSQIHMKEGKFKYFTRNGFDITDNQSYGETRFSGGLLTSRIARLLNPDCRSIIMDGELMGWHKEKKRFGSKGMSFDVKKMSATSAHQPCFVAFDVIMYNNELLVDKPLTARLKLLEIAFKEKEGVFIRSKTKAVSNESELLKVFNESLDSSEEGIVLKRCDSVYKPKIREGSGCYKIKAEYSESLIQDIDMVILGGYYGEGRQRGLINSFLVGVALPPTNQGDDPIEFFAVSSVGTGIGIEKLEEIQVRFEQHWVKECPMGVIGPKTRSPNLWIHPKNSIVLQLRATEMIRSSNYPTGYSLRFPRVVKIRDDKSWHDCCTVKEFQSLVKDTGVIQKLTKRHATTDDVENTQVIKSVKKAKSKPIGVDKNFIGVAPSEVIRITRLLDGKEFCVINGNDKLSKKDVEKILLEHGAKVVQNPRVETFCVIVGNANKIKAKNVIRSKKYDVATLDWLLRITRTEDLSVLEEWLPWELLSCKNSSEQCLSVIYDDYYDSYTQDADTESLNRTLNKAGEIIEDTEMTMDQFKEIDTELFENGVSPFSPLRGIIGYFDCHAIYGKHGFLFLGGIFKTDIDDTVTHVFVNKNNLERYDNYRKINEARQETFKILDEEWIEDCFREHKLLPDTKYFVTEGD